MSSDELDELEWLFSSVASPTCTSSSSPGLEDMVEENSNKRKLLQDADDMHEQEHAWTTNKQPKIDWQISKNVSTNSQTRDDASCVYIENTSTSNSVGLYDNEELFPADEFKKFVFTRGHIFARNCKIGSKITCSIFHTPSNGSYISPSMKPEFTHLGDFQITITTINSRQEELIIKLGTELSKFKSTIKPNRKQFAFIQFGSSQEKYFLYCEPKHVNMHNVAFFDGEKFIGTERRNIKGFKGSCKVETVLLDQEESSDDQNSPLS